MNIGMCQALEKLPHTFWANNRLKVLKKGRPLNALERENFAPYFKHQTLASAQIFEGNVPFWLRKKMCAVVLGSRIYFRRGVYQPNQISSVELLAHELTHVEQYLSGMNLLKYCWASRFGYQKNPYEIEAYAKGKAVRFAIENNHYFFKRAN